MEPISFGRYVLIDRIAAGGMGEVFLAVPRTLWSFGKFFAIKRVLPNLSRDPEFLARFRDEARLVIPMNHPNVVQVLEVGRVEEDYFITMELVEGQNLGRLIARCRQQGAPLAVPAALFIIRELLAGLEYCHRRTDEAGRRLGLVHRDVSPSNVLVSYDGGVKLADFGLALSSLKLYQTGANIVLGHFGYIAPEALDGVRVDHRADIFSTGVLLFELLTSQRFCTATEPALVRRELRARERVLPSACRSGIPAGVDRLVQRAVRCSPEQRFESARAFHDDVQRELVQIDPLFGAAALRETVMHCLFDVEAHNWRRREMLNALDLEEIETCQPAGRTFCIGEAIPLGSRQSRPRFGSGARMLTLIEDLLDGDTQPYRLAAPSRASGSRRFHGRFSSAVRTLESRSQSSTASATGQARRAQSFTPIPR